MTQKTPTHAGYHFDKTLEYITGSGSDLSQRGYSTMNDGLPHDLFHVLYYAGVYIGGPIFIIAIIGFIITAFDFHSEEVKKDKEFLDSLIKGDDKK